MVIYRAVSPSGKIYIGKTHGSLCKRRLDHERDARLGERTAFHRALRKYGAATFEWREIARCCSPHMLDWIERSYIALFSSQRPNGYNITAGGGGFRGSHSAETRTKLSRLGRGRKQTAEHVEKRMRAHIGAKRSANTRAKLSAASKGRKASAATRAKMSAQNTGENNPFYGRGHTAETKAKIGAATKLRAQDPEYRQKMSDAQKRRPPLSAEARAKLSEAQRGKKRTDETRARIAASKCGKKRAPFSEEWRANLSAAGKRRYDDIAEREKQANRMRGNKHALGYRHTAETRAKLSAANERRWAERKRKKKGSGE